MTPAKSSTPSVFASPLPSALSSRRNSHSRRLAFDFPRYPSGDEDSSAEQSHGRIRAPASASPAASDLSSEAFSWSMPSLLSSLPLLPGQHVDLRVRLRAKEEWSTARLALLLFNSNPPSLLLTRVALVSQPRLRGSCVLRGEEGQSTVPAAAAAHHLGHAGGIGVQQHRRRARSVDGARLRFSFQPRRLRSAVVRCVTFHLPPLAGGLQQPLGLRLRPHLLAQRVLRTLLHLPHPKEERSTVRLAGSLRLRWCCSVR